MTTSQRESHASPSAVVNQPPAHRRWVMLALGTAAQTAACAFVYGMPYLIPSLRSAEGLTLAQAGVMVACPTVGLLLALYAWGAATDRYGERWVLAGGLGLATAALVGAQAAHGLVVLGLLFAVAGAAGASVSAASGRVVLGWFPPERRGLAMGVRQTSTPLGMLVAAVAVPPISAAHGLPGAVLFVAVLSGVMAVLTALFVVDPPRPAPTAKQKDEKPASPYRGATLWRIHGASALMVWPQFTVGAFGLVYLTDVRHWPAVAAGQLMACGQALAAVCRIAAGRWSDAVGSRLRPMRWLAGAVAVLGAVLAAAGDSAVGVVLLIVLTGLSASTNGLSFTSVAELAGPGWAGRALAVQNTGQNLTASLCPPAVGALITAAGFGSAFAVAAGCALASIAVLPPRVPTTD
ncbi:MFS transporter [Streptacidiphilus jiangxiensis]|uniref:Sugar phosphate permease n=1 Tax=Streptacidiphilus jiangxiensis TaxID=235985 RepID=A0A1H7XZY3_STRJI|nr:MFS transporter [Streptacidiphilus jiangxiensis]SEM39380.1 Sugar phosphate permease [Streptacidiphilus jiangxiensis]